MKIMELVIWTLSLFLFTVTVNASNLPRPKKPVICVESVTAQYDKDVLASLTK